MFLYKTLPFGVLALMTACVFVLGVSGRRNAASSSSGKLHRSAARTLLGLTVLMVLLLEAGVRLRGGAKPDILFFAHLGFAGPFLGLLVFMNFWATGEKSRNHAILAYALAAFFAGLAVTGSMLIWRIPVI